MKPQRSLMKRPVSTAIWNRIETIRKIKDGRLRPVDLVDEARNPSSILHPFFEWDDSEAAERFRRLQASRLLYVVHATIIGPQALARRPAYVRITVQKQRTFVTTAQAIKEPELSTRVITAALRDLLSWHRRYRDLTELKSLDDFLTDFLVRKGLIQDERDSSTAS